MESKNEFRKFATKHLGLHGGVVDQYIENMTRSVIEERLKPFREIDVFSRLIMDRIIFLGTEIDHHISNVIVAQLLFLESVDRDKDILLYVNSPGGSVYHGLAIYDTMQYVSPLIRTTCVGLAASMGAVLLAGGAPGKRSALPHSRIMIHQASGQARGKMTEMENALEEMVRLNRDVYKLLALHIKKPAEEIRQASVDDFWMTSYEAKDYGVVDHVLINKEKL